MDPYDSPLRSPIECSSPNDPFPHSLLRTRQFLPSASIGDYSLRCLWQRDGLVARLQGPGPTGLAGSAA